MSRDKQREKTMSWVIKNIETGEVVCELTEKSNVDKLNTAKYEAVGIKEHLYSLNALTYVEKLERGVLK